MSKSLRHFAAYKHKNQRPITRFRCPMCKKEFAIPYDFKNPTKITCPNGHNWMPTGADVVAGGNHE
jgi:hypothetical protein